ncbi:50S ribosomal protein L35 [Candidatus Peregrinibacteria bacterium]|nr:50S ribosomal protein L35 [Candidatus Peregrinibacteria bacterium]
MKQKTHSGLKKRINIRKSGTATVQKSCKNHLLSNKSKRQKKANNSGQALPQSRKKHLRRLLPGQL